MAQLLSSNVAGYLNCSSGVFSSNQSPLKNTATQSLTGLAVVMRANTSRTSTTTMAVEANLTLTINETGVYLLGGILYVNRNTGTGNGGIKIDFGGGNCTVNSIYWSALGVINSAPNVANSVKVNTTAISFTTIANTKTDWLSVTGILNINVAGTLIPRYAQFVSNVRPSNIAANSFLYLTKVG